MRNPNVRVALEAWNFCNEVGIEAPNMGSSRMADCTDFYCPLLTVTGQGVVSYGKKCKVHQKVNESDNSLGAGDKFPVGDFKSYVDPDLFAVEKELYLGYLCEVQDSAEP